MPLKDKTKRKLYMRAYAKAYYEKHSAERKILYEANKKEICAKRKIYNAKHVELKSVQHHHNFIILSLYLKTPVLKTIKECLFILLGTPKKAALLKSLRVG
jgi:hypothetical protein